MPGFSGDLKKQSDAATRGVLYTAALADCAQSGEQDEDTMAAYPDSTVSAIQGHMARQVQSI